MDMTQILKRALPFILAFVFGVACTAIIRGVLPAKKGFYSGGRRSCGSQEKMRRDFSTGRRFIPVSKEVPVLNVIEMPNSATVVSSPVILSSDSSRHAGLTLKEQALVTSAKRSEFNPGTSRIISYVSPDNIDGEPVTSDAVISHIPRPRFWNDEQRRRRATDCNAIVRVNLDSSGSIPAVERVSGYADSCAHLDDILDAARDISFQPARRDGIPVSQRISIMYRLN